ncbi:uncharacterized protein TM35_000022820 [Trypanosoma theileri]|uniref:Uncharacterized protein n=1 Tax=Trypanosoma theileri TaxID=67003 RepID=A0A1X0P7N9_9TRYP|nr:uncharacterized protein TM35_000022820 [Trypanosoma theileri]ORC92956.1 hypothetical protein TM35_000022820 [Trypanosoma theileri]
MDNSLSLLLLLDLLRRMTRSESIASPSPPRPPTVEELFGSIPSREEEEQQQEEEVEEKDRERESLQVTARRFARHRKFAEVDIQALCAETKRLIDDATTPTGAARFARMAPELDTAISLLEPVCVADPRVALCVSALIANLAANPESRGQLYSAAVWDLALLIAQTYMTEPTVLLRALVALSNLACEQSLLVTREHCQVLSRLIFPLHTEPRIVEAWATLICNLTAYHRETSQVFVEFGVVEVLQRLLLYLGEDSRCAVRGLQCLVNLAMGFTSGQPPVLPLS